MKKIAGAYIRVSTDEQTELSPDSQIKNVREFAKNKGYSIPSEYIFRDDGISGRSASKRPEFSRMIALAKSVPTPFSAIFVWKFSRFARNQQEAIFYKGMLKKSGVQVISTSEPILDTPFGSLIERIIEWFDEYYSINLSTEVKRGMEEKVSRGGAVAVPPFGYDIVKGKYVINKEKSQFVQKIFSDYLSGKDASTIAGELNKLGVKTTRGNPFEKRTVEYILENPVYAGKIRWNSQGKTGRIYNQKGVIITQGLHTPIITENTFDRVTKLLLKEKTLKKQYPKKNKGKDYMLRGLVHCSSCNSVLSLGANNHLQCSGYAHRKCKASHYISLEELNNVVITALESIFTNRCYKALNDTLPRESSLNITALVEKENSKLKRIQYAYEEGVYSLKEYKERKSKIEKQIKNIKECNKQQSENTKPQSRKTPLIQQLKSDEVTEKEKNRILKAFIEKIIYEKENSSVSIYLKTHQAI